MTTPYTLTKAELLQRLQTGWAELNRFADSLTAQQLTGPTDAGGWTVKDHLIHLAIWEESVIALLDGGSRSRAMGVDEQFWVRGDWDGMNAVVQQRYHALSLADARRMQAEIHQRLLDKIEALSDGDLHRPYADYQSGSDGQGPVIDSVAEASYRHYAEHRPWMEAIPVSVSSARGL